jgi:hypothetical protein
MNDIKTIPDAKLKQDLDESYVDIKVCEKALLLGITKYNSGSVRKRLNDNQYFVGVITAEIQRRKTSEINP